MKMTSNLGKIDERIRSELPQALRIRIRFDISPAETDCGWSARSSGELTNDERRAFIAAVYKAQRKLHFWGI
jgi:hypothetical protein